MMKNKNIKDLKLQLKHLIEDQIKISDNPSSREKLSSVDTMSYAELKHQIADQIKMNDYLKYRKKLLDVDEMNNQVKLRILMHANDAFRSYYGNSFGIVRIYSDEHVDMIHQIRKDLINNEFPPIDKVWDVYSLVKNVEWAARHILLISLCVSIIPATLVAVKNYIESSKSKDEQNYISLSDLLKNYIEKPIDDWVMNARTKGASHKMLKEIIEREKTWRSSEKIDLGHIRHTVSLMLEEALHDEVWRDSPGRNNKP